MEFYRNKKKSMNLILISAVTLVVMTGVFLYSIGLFDNQVGAKLAGVSGLFSIILAIVIVSKLLILQDTSPLVIIHNEGIISKTTAVSKAAGLILWKDIINIHLEKVGADTLVTLTVNRPDHYLPLIKKKLSGMISNRLVTEDGNLPISLTAAELSIDANELSSVITSFFRNDIKKPSY